MSYTDTDALIKKKNNVIIMRQSIQNNQPQKKYFHRYDQTRAKGYT